MGNEGTTQFGTAEVLAGEFCEILDRPDQGPEATTANLSRIAAVGPDLVMDNGAELIAACLASDHAPRGATEETTSGAYALREDHAGQVGFPVIVIDPNFDLVPGPQPVPETINNQVATAMLHSMGQLR